MKTVNALPSNRSFGILWSGIFFALAIRSLFYSQESELFFICGWLISGTLMLVVTFSTPKLLTPFNKAWMNLGGLMGKITSPIILGGVFFFIITPIALIMRIAGRDELALKQKQGHTYWVTRNPPGPAEGSFKNQF